MIRHALRHISDIQSVMEDHERFLVVTDYDGTLCPIAATPGEASMPQSVAAAFERVVQSGRATVAVVSGRALSDLEKRISFPVILSGNHGLQIRSREIEFEHPEAKARRPMLVSACETVLATVSRWTGAWVEDKGLTATVHYRNVELQHHREVVWETRRAMSPFCPSFGMRAGKRALEIHPRVGWDKGSALDWIRETLGMQDQSCLCLGDDRTDENMFRVRPGQINIRVGNPERTAAQFHVADPFEVAALLSQLLSGVGSHSTSRKWASAATTTRE